ncbi:60S acidic ribosomal protein P2 [Saitozyma sp. JCM 24511]|nr:60S acidic ribosomal protein P2 [Saitozyma sp. JCM 24511]
MKYLASYLLLQLGGNASPSASDISALLETVGVEAESEQLDKLIAELEGKDINEVSEALGYAQALDGWCGTCVAEKERSLVLLGNRRDGFGAGLGRMKRSQTRGLIAEGSSKFASIPSGGAAAAGGAAPAAAAAGGAAAEAAPAEEKKEEAKEESDDDMGFGLFD